MIRMELYKRYVDAANNTYLCVNNNGPNDYPFEVYDENNSMMVHYSSSGEFETKCLNVYNIIGEYCHED